MRNKVGVCQLPRLLQRKGWTQQQLSERIGISVSQLSDYATNRRTMSLKNATVIAGALGCAVEDLYYWVSSDNQGGNE
jgi:transcriptional regulator with XRE-family HTH domain